jgi:hypothetical protein
MQGIWSSSVAALCFRLSANFVHGNDREPELPVFRTSCDCLIPGGCPACQGDVRLGGKDWPTQAYQRDEPDAATLKARFEARFGDDAQPSATNEKRGSIVAAPLPDFEPSYRLGNHLT